MKNSFDEKLSQIMAYIYKNMEIISKDVEYVCDTIMKLEDRLNKSIPEEPLLTKIPINCASCDRNIQK